MVHPYLLAKQPSGAKVSRYNRKTGKIEAPETPSAPAAGGDGKSGDAALNLLSAASALASLEGPPPLPGQEVPFAPGAAAAAAAADQQTAGIDTSYQSPRGKPTADRSPSNNKRFPDLVSSHSTNLDRAPRILCPRGGELIELKAMWPHFICWPCPNPIVPSSTHL